LTGLNDNIAPAADNRRLAGVVGYRHQSDVIDEVDVEEIVRLLLRKLTPDREEATVKRPELIRAIAACMASRSWERCERISTVRPSRNVSVAE
jgi:hypothetical protein